MANYSRKDAEDQGNAEVGLGATLLTSLATLLLGSLAKSSSEKKKNQKVNNRKQQIIMEIEDIDRQIAACKSSLFGAWLNSEEINSLEKKRAELIAEYNRLEEGK